MARGLVTLQIFSPSEDITLPTGTERGRKLNSLIDFLTGLLIGAKGRPDTVLSVGEGGARASGTVTLSGAAGTVSATINGIVISATFATSDANTASLLAAAINASANTLVSGIVTASSALGVVTITAVEYGKTGNAVTLAAGGTGATASGPRLTGGVTEGLVALRR